MSAAGRSQRASELLLEHCFALTSEPPRPSAQDRLEAALGRELARRLVATLAPAAR